MGKPNRLVQKVRASGYHPNQPLRKKRAAKFSFKQNLSTADTRKGQGRAYISRDGKPINFKPIGAPRARSL